MARSSVLVVEDDPSLRSDAVLLFETAGFEVASAADADEALALVWDRSDDFAAVFTDIQMPGWSDGLHLAEVVARHWPHILVLLTSGRASPIEPLPGNVRFIPKPWLPLEVLTAVQQVVKG